MNRNIIYIQTLIEMDNTKSLGDSLAHLMEIQEKIKNRELFKDLGKQLSDIINQDGDDKSDGEVIDEIVLLLTKLGIYERRK